MVVVALVDESLLWAVPGERCNGRGICSFFLRIASFIYLFCDSLVYFFLQCRHVEMATLLCVLFFAPFGFLLHPFFYWTSTPVFYSFFGCVIAS